MSTLDFLKTILLSIILLTLPSVSSLAQEIVHFNGKGELYGKFPRVLRPEDKLVYKITTEEDPTGKYSENLKKQAEKAVIHLQAIKSDEDMLGILEEVYGISSDDLDSLIEEYGLVIQKPDSNNASIRHIPVLPAVGPYTLKFSPSKEKAAQLYANKASDPIDVKTSLDGVKALTFDLSLTDQYQQVVLNWFNTKKGSFRQAVTAAQIIQLKSLVKLYADPVSKAKLFIRHHAYDKDDESPLDEQIAKLQQLIKDELSVEQSLNTMTAELQPLIDFKGNKPWVLNWLWYQQGNLPQLNPFKFKQGKDLFKGDTTGLKALQDRLLSRENLIKNANYRKVTTTALDSYISEAEGFRNQIKPLLAALKKQNDEASENEKNIRAFTATTTLLNHGLFYVSGAGPDATLYMMRHHDARNNNEIMDLSEITEYTEDDQVVLLTHNLKANEKAEYQLSFKPIAAVQSVFADNVLDALGAWQKGLAGTGGFGDSLSVLKNTLLKTLSKNLRNIKTQLSVYAGAEYLVSQTTPELNIPETGKTDTVYHSQKDIVPQRHKNELVNYTVNVTTAKSAAATAAAAPSPAAAPAVTAKGIPADTMSYRVNKLYRIFPMAGFAFSFPAFASVDNTGKVTTETPSHFFVGLKVYIQKTDIRSTRVFWQKDLQGRPLFWSRFSVDAAVDLKSALNNIYLGAGLDIWPGFCINGGMVLNKYNYYRYANGAAIQSQTGYRKGAFVGLSTDVSVIAQLVKLLKL